MNDNQQQIINTLAKFSWHSFLGDKHPGTPLTITYCFLASRPDYYSGIYGDAWLDKARSVADANSFAVLSYDQVDVFAASMLAWSSVAGITFTSPGDGQIGHIAIANVALKPNNIAATSSPTSVTEIGVEGDIFLKNMGSGLALCIFGFMQNTRPDPIAFYCFSFPYRCL